MTVAAMTIPQKYPAVGPTNIAILLVDLANTGSPAAKSINHENRDKNALEGVKVIAINSIPAVCKVIGTG